MYFCRFGHRRNVAQVTVVKVTNVKPVALEHFRYITVSHQHVSAISAVQVNLHKLPQKTKFYYGDVLIYLV